MLGTLSDGENEIIVNPFADNTFILKDFSSSDKVNPSDMKNYLPKVETTLTLRIQNNSKTSAIKLFSIFPGNYNEKVKINTLSGFVMTTDADFKALATADEIQRVKSYMNGGFFYE